MQIVIITPVFQDWESFVHLVSDLDREIASAGHLSHVQFSVLAVDDGSIDAAPASPLSEPKAIKRVEVLRMAVNMGHQRAIALGAVHVANSVQHDAAVIMDADGEDLPSDVIRLVEAHLERPNEVILARRSKRSEPLSFRTGYRIYRLLFLVLTGQDLPFGNFSLVPKLVLGRLVCSSDVWNHFAAAIARSRHPTFMIDSFRGKRYAGRSHVNWVSLVIHGLSAMSVHSDRIAIRLIVASGLVMTLSMAAVFGVVGVRFLTDLAIPGWASAVVGMLSLASLSSISFAALLAFITLQARQGVTFVPKVDGSKYITQVETWCPKKATSTSVMS